MGYGKQPPPHSPFTRPCVLHTVFVRVHHPEVRGGRKLELPWLPSGKESSELEVSECQWVLGDGWNFGGIYAVVRDSSLCLMFFPMSASLSSLFPLLQTIPLPSLSPFLSSKSKKPQPNSGGPLQLLVDVPPSPQWVPGTYAKRSQLFCLLPHSVWFSFSFPSISALLPGHRVLDMRRRVPSLSDSGLPRVVHGTEGIWLQVLF